MIDLKADFSGGLNLDDAYYAVPKNSYVDAVNITRDAIAGSNDRAITNVFGNRLIQKIKSKIVRVPSPGAHEDVSIYIDTTPVSANTRIIVTLLLQPSNTPVKVLDYTSPTIFTFFQYASAAVDSMSSSILTASGIVIQGGNIAPGPYNGVFQDSTDGFGFDGVFDIVIGGGNVVTAVNIVDGGLNYKVGDVITIDGSQFGGISGQDDVQLTVLTLTLRSGILLASANPPNEIAFRYNLNSGAGTYYNWGNYSVTIGHLTSGYTCIGAYANQTRNTIIYFLHNTQGYHIILEYNITSEVITKIFESKIDSGDIDILNFTLASKITGINVFNREEGDLLYFLDTLGRPTGMDMELFKNNHYNPVTRDIIDVCKRPPLSPPVTRYDNDNTKKSNNLRGKFFRFKYRYVYDDFSKSVCSPISKLPLPLNILDTSYVNNNSNNNYVELQFNSGDKDVKKVELLMSYVDKTNDWSDFVLIEEIQKEVKFTVKTSVDVFLSPPALNGITIITLGGSAISQAEIKIFFKDLNTNTNILVTTWVIGTNQSLENVATSLASSIIVSPSIDATSNGVSVIFKYDTSQWQYEEVTIDYLQGQDNIELGYKFYNDASYPFIDINESIQLYDYVPTNAKAQELANGNVLLYGAITEGYNKDLNTSVFVDVLTQPFGPPNTGQGFFNIVISNITYTNGLTQRNAARYEFYGLPPAGTTIKLYVKSGPTEYQMCQYTTLITDNLNSIVTGLYNSLFTLPAQTGFFQDRTGTILSPPPILDICSLQSAPFVNSRVEYIFPPGSVFSNPQPTFLFNSQRNIGIAYFDKKGRTNGIIWNSKLSFPNYAENNSGQVLLPYINLKVYHQPPIWAESFQFYLTKENTQFLYWYGKVVDGGQYWFFDISSLYRVNQQFPTRAIVQSWSFQDGDRFSLIKNLNTNAVYSGLYDIEALGIIPDAIINGSPQTGKTFIKIAKQGAFSANLSQADVFEFVIYRNNIPPNDPVYYEFGEQYYVSSSGLPDRAHNGSVVSQQISTGTPAEFNFYYGDVYFKNRFTIPGEVGINIGNYFVLDRNILDEYISAVSSISGRPNIIDQNARETFFPTLVRYSQAYQPNTNINGLPRFFFANFDEYDYNYGDIERFKTRDRFIRVFQKLKVGMVPLYQQMVKNQGTETLVISDKLLNPVQYYVGDVGIGDNPESLASFSYADYFTSNIRGVICRASQDGVEFISITNKINSWANQNIGDLDKRFMVGCFDQRLSNYILALTSSKNNPVSTIVYDQEYGNFESFLTMYPEMMASLGVTLASFKDGQIYIHDNSPYNTFYGLPAAESSITPIFNANPYQKKTFLALSEVASTIWDCPTLSTDINSYGTVKQLTVLVPSDFAQLEGTFEAPVLRDLYSIGGIVNGDTMKGKYLVAKFRKEAASSLVALNIVSCKYIDSPLTNR